MTDGWKPNIVLYHSHCDDGFASAWACWRRWPDAQYVPMHYNGALPDIVGKHVLMVDFSLKYDAMLEAARTTASIVVLDHHRTAKDELALFTPLETALTGRAVTPELIGSWVGMTPETNLRIYAVFDMEKSGCRLAWEFCHPSEPMPRLLEHIEDRDLWRFKLECTRQVSAALRSHDLTFELFDRGVEEDGWERLALQGVHILRMQEKHVADFLEQAYMAEVAGFTVPVLNVPYAYASDCGHALLKKYPEAPFAATWWRLKEGKEGWSLRSEDDREDVAKIAAWFGGGGHRNASGFTLPALTATIAKAHEAAMAEGAAP